MAEGWLRHLAGDVFVVESAGTEPRDRVHPLAIQVMAEAGVDISGAYPKMLDRFIGQPWDFVITVCDNANESCPVFPGPNERIHWSFSDPAAAEGSEEERLTVFRRVRDEILTRLRLFASAQARASV
jgi:arsenate reductase